MDIGESIDNPEEREELQQMAKETLSYRINKEGKLHKAATQILTRIKKADNKDSEDNDTNSMDSEE